VRAVSSGVIVNVTVLVCPAAGRETVMTEPERVPPLVTPRVAPELMPEKLRSAVPLALASGSVNFMSVAAVPAVKIVPPVVEVTEAPDTVAPIVKAVAEFSTCTQKQRTEIEAHSAQP
jgi:hypothetical protein